MADLKRTSLTHVHELLGAKMVPFAGYLMPIQYTSILEEHHAVRKAAGVFDVSHMGEFFFQGPRALEAIQKVTVNDAASLGVDQAQYSAMVREDGGILDDCIVYRLADEEWMMVVNASNIAKDWEHVQAHLPSTGVVVRDRSEEVTLLAIQGPHALEVVQPLADVRLDEIPYYEKRDGKIGASDVVFSRTGYTGEDGLELYFFDGEEAESIWNGLMLLGSDFGIRPAGLGARDTLRLEMKYALYGNDIDETTNPYEGGLSWIVKLDKEGDFVGRAALERIAAEGQSRRLVGFQLGERGIPRPGYPVSLDGEVASEVRSGAMSPSLGVGIGTCYLPRGHTKAGTAIGIEVRGKTIPAEVVKTPFYTEGSLKR